MNQLILQRQQKDQFFKISPDSPLTPEQQAHFDGLRYYPPNPVLAFTLLPEIFADKANIRMQTSAGDVRYYQRWGRVRFTIEGQNAELTLYYAPGSATFFVPFMDATSGHETYGAGRYLDIDQQSNGEIHLDFNEAYSPYCAYNEPIHLAAAAGREARTWSCPIPPVENRLKVPIQAGEKKPEGSWIMQDE